MLIITTLALLMAASMGWMALRLLREEQRRSEARVAALSAALDAPWPVAEPATTPVAAQPTVPTQHVPAVTAPAAIALTPVATQPVAAAPQIVALDDTSPHEYFASAASFASHDDGLHADASEPTRPMFGAGTHDVDATPRDDRRWLAVAAAVLVGLGIVSVWWSTSGTSDAAGTTVTAPVTAAPAAGMPVELVSLGHERTEAGLVIRGLVRNPAAASTRTGTVASVFLFDEAGGFLGSGRSVLDTPTLTPGDEAGFEVTLPGNAKVRRYRVTFRAADGTVVPHLDKRRGQV